MLTKLNFYHINNLKQRDYKLHYIWNIAKMYAFSGMVVVVMIKFSFFLLETYIQFPTSMYFSINQVIGLSNKFSITGSLMSQKKSFFILLPEFLKLEPQGLKLELSCIQIKYSATKLWTLNKRN